MKRTLATILFTFVLACLGGVSARADLIWYEGFDYADGPVTNGAVWTKFSGTGNPCDMTVNNNKLEIAATISGTSTSPLSRQDDCYRRLATVPGSPYTNSLQVLYASFTVSCTNLPNGAGTYFSSFYSTASGFFGRVYGLTNGTAAPNSWRLGVSGNSTAVSKVYPVDLATNTQYQVVVQWDPVTLYAISLWVNPLSPAETSVTSGDVIATPPIVNAFAARQASGFGSAFFLVTNLATATTFEEAATNIWSTDPVPPVVVYPPKDVTNFIGAPVTLSVVANGQNLGGLTYQWRQDDLDISNPNGNTNLYVIPSLDTPYVGQYTVVIANPNTGLSTTSQVANVVIDTRPLPPFFVQQPVSTNVYPGKNVTLYAPAAGPQPITNQWYRNNSPLSDDATFTGTATPSLLIANVQTNNGTTGTYKCVASNVNGETNSSNAALSVVLPAATNILYLRSLVDPTFFLATNTSIYWTASGVVTVYTNLTGSPNMSTVIQDSTAGIGVFMSGGAAQLPEAGTAITVTGPLGSFNGVLQFTLNASDPSTFFVTNSTGNLLPAPIVLPLSFTNGVAYGGVSNVFRRFMSSRIMFTNVYFTDAGNTYASGQISEVITNQLGDSMTLFFNAAVSPNFTGQLIPDYAWSVTGVMSTFLSAGATNRTTGFELLPTRFEDYITTAPQASTPTIALVANKPVINWAAELLTSYSILKSTNVNGPYTPLASGLTFNTPAGLFTDTNTVSGNRFYEIVSP